jgi:hypothetical protein
MNSEPKTQTTDYTDDIVWFIKNPRFFSTVALFDYLNFQLLTIDVQLNIFDIRFWIDSNSEL